MTLSNQTPRPSRGENVLACSVIFFSLALLCFLLGWAEGVHHGRAYLRMPQTGGWPVAAAILGGMGVICFLGSRGTKRS